MVTPIRARLHGFYILLTKGGVSSAVIGIAVMAILTLTVWGIDPFCRGIRIAGDDLNFLAFAWTGSTRPFLAQIFARYPLDSPTRSLAMWPFVLATQTPAPTVFLQLFYGAAWLINGVAVAHLARAIWPGSRTFPYLAGCLMVTATSDWHTDSVIYGPHLLGIAFFFLGTSYLFRSAGPNGTLAQATGGGFLLLGSFFTVEYTYLAVPLLPLLIWWHHGSLRNGKVWRAIIALGLSFAPAATSLALFLRDPGTHARSVLASTQSGKENFALIVAHIAHNCNFPAWGLRRIPPWYDNYGSVIPPGVFVAIASFGSLVALGGLACFRYDVVRKSVLNKRYLAGAAVLFLAALLCVNSVSARVGTEYFVRSHFVSRGWASLFLALILSVSMGFPRAKFISAAAFGAIIFAGIWGGVERQSYYLAYGLSERRELASLLDAVPSFNPGAKLVVIQPPGGPTFLGINNPNTLPFLYGDPRLSVSDRIVVAPNSAEEYSTVGSDGVGRIRITRNTGDNIVVDPATSILVFYSNSLRRFVRLDEIPASMMRDSNSSWDSYDPTKWLTPGQPSSTPVAIRDFLSHERSCWPSPPRSTPALPQMLAVSSPSNALSADSLVPSVIERSGTAPFVWLGSGRSEGYSSLVTSRVSTAARLTIKISPGPSRPDSVLHLRTRVSPAGQPLQECRIDFDAATSLLVPLKLNAGSNVIEIWVEEEPEMKLEYDPRNPLARLEPMLLVSE